ncbi:MAG: NAD-dependent epimerase/dehydratase family protein, partial [Bacteroidota bacterium]
MVIGNGMIAKIFNSYQSGDGFIIFASGVSHSAHTDAKSSEREKQLLADVIRRSGERHLVYFGTCGVYDPSMRDSAYIKHKLKMEAYIQQHQAQYTIFRLSNPIGKTTNNDTVVNFFIKHILDQETFNVWKNASRNIIDIDDMYLVCHEILEKKMFTNSIVNIA